MTEQTQIADMKLHLKNQGEITQKVYKQELSFLYMTYCHRLFYITVKYHDYIPKGIQVTERTRICIKKHQRGENSKSIKGELSFLYATYCHDLFYITVKYHQNIPNSFKVTERTRKCLWTYRRTDGQTITRLIAISLNLWLGDKHCTIMIHSKLQEPTLSNKLSFYDRYLNRDLHVSSTQCKGQSTKVKIILTSSSIACIIIIF